MLSSVWRDKKQEVYTTGSWLMRQQSVKDLLPHECKMFCKI
jgi:hypothetical protein